MSLRYDARLTRLPISALFEARGSDHGIAAGLVSAGLRMPTNRNQMEMQEDQVELIRLGPERVMVLADIEIEAELDARLQAGFATIAEADIALVSDMYIAFELEGVGAEDVLRQGAPLDLSRDNFPPLMATGTQLWDIGIILIRLLGEREAFRIIVERSYAGYIEDWLGVAMGGTSTQKPGVMVSPPKSLMP